MRALVLLCLFAAVAHADEPELAFFDTPADALRELLRRQPNARVLAFGEVHEQNGGSHATPAIRRFADQMMSAVPSPGDLIVETWVEKDSCGEVAKVVTKQVGEMTKRPESTETDIMRLLRLGKDHALRPHVLDLSCEKWRSLQDKDGKLDAVALLGVVTDELRKAILTYLPKKDPVIVYGGALHNDRAPRKELAQFSFAAPIDKASHGKFLEIDLYVPEYVEHDEQVTTKSWWAHWLAEYKTHPTSTALIRAGKGSYVFLFPPGK